MDLDNDHVDLGMDEERYVYMDEWPLSHDQLSVTLTYFSPSFDGRNEPQQRPHLPDREWVKLRKALSECGAMAYNPRYD